jgi:hypothetical protein
MPRISCDFNILSKAVQPDEFAQSLRLVPDVALRRGEVVDTPIAHRSRPTNILSLRSELHVASDLLEEHAIYILAQLERAESTIKAS